MNEQTDFERLVADQLASVGTGTPPESAIEDTITRAGGTRRLPEWLALIKEPPMRTNSHLAVGSPTVRVVAIMAVTMLLALALAAAGAGAQRLLAADSPIVVARDGSGDYATIAEAVAAAVDGDEILVKQGTYVEAVVIDKDVALIGDGPLEGIVITAPDAGPVYLTGMSATREEEYALVLAGSDAKLANLTFSGENARLIIDGGAPTIEQLVFDGVGKRYTGHSEVAAVVVRSGSTAIVRDNTFLDEGGINVFESSTPLIERNQLDTGPGIYGDFGDDTIIADNHLFGPGLYGISMGSPSGPTILGNTISDRDMGIEITGAAMVEKNSVSNSNTHGIDATMWGSPQGEAATLRDNQLVGNDTAIAWTGGDGVIEGNDISGGRAGIVIANGAPVVQDNTVETVAGRGIVVARDTAPVFSGNRSCDNDDNLVVVDGGTPVDDGTNEFCEDAAAA